MTYPPSQRLFRDPLVKRCAFNPIRSKMVLGCYVTESQRKRQLARIDPTQSGDPCQFHGR
jgi:hypothetical protein